MTAAAVAAAAAGAIGNALPLTLKFCLCYTLQLGVLLPLLLLLLLLLAAVGFYCCHRGEGTAAVSGEAHAGAALEVHLAVLLQQGLCVCVGGGATQAKDIVSQWRATCKPTSEALRAELRGGVLSNEPACWCCPVKHLAVLLQLGGGMQAASGPPQIVRCIKALAVPRTHSTPSYISPAAHEIILSLKTEVTPVPVP